MKNISIKHRKSLTTELILLVVLVIFWIFLSKMSPYFFTIANIENIFNQQAVVGILAIGQLFVILTGGIDLSVGMVLALSNISLALLTVNGCSVPLAIILVLLLTSSIGFFNGFMVYKLRLPAFIVTLSTMSIATGVTLLISRGTSIFGLPSYFSGFISKHILALPSLTFVFLLVVIIGELILRHSVFGRHIYAIGGSLKAARLSGVNIKAVICSVYTISGFLAGVGGVLQTCLLNMGVPTTGANYNLESIAAVIIGGASLLGGKGTAIGAFLGSILTVTMYNGAVLMNVNPFWQLVVLGIIILFVVTIDQLRKGTRLYE